MKELLILKDVLDKINPENDNIPLELLDELNEKLQYALGWCEGWLAGNDTTNRQGARADVPILCDGCGSAYIQCLNCGREANVRQMNEATKTA